MSKRGPLARLPFSARRRLVDVKWALIGLADYLSPARRYRRWERRRWERRMRRRKEATARFEARWERRMRRRKEATARFEARWERRIRRHKEAADRWEAAVLAMPRRVRESPSRSVWRWLWVVLHLPQTWLHRLVVVRLDVLAWWYRRKSRRPPR